jgi:hypothetical protein
VTHSKIPGIVAAAFLIVLGGLVLAMTQTSGRSEHGSPRNKTAASGVAGDPASRPSTAAQAPATAATGSSTASSPPAVSAGGSPLGTNPQASPQQIQQTVVGILAQMQQLARDANGAPRAVTAEEVEARLREELAKVGLRA